MNWPSFDLGLAWAVLALAALSSIPAVFALAFRLRDRKPKDRFYEDADGSSTPEALARFSNRRSKAAILLFSALGAGISIAILALSVISDDDGDEESRVLEHGLLAATWVSDTRLFFSYYIAFLTAPN